MATVKQLELQLKRANTKIDKLKDDLSIIKDTKKTIQENLREAKALEKEAKKSKTSPIASSTKRKTSRRKWGA